MKKGTKEECQQVAWYCGKWYWETKSSEWTEAREEC